jgi:putative DNA primase/helicase
MEALFKGNETIDCSVMPGAIASSDSFDIRNFIDQLEPTRVKNKYICPVCGGHNLSINPNNGKYSCYNECLHRDIREAIKPWSQVLEERKLGQIPPPRPLPIKAKKPASTAKVLDVDPSQLKICRLGGEITTPQPITPDFVPKSVISKLKEDGATPSELKQITVIEYEYGDGRKVHRFSSPCAAKDKGTVKTFSVSRLDPTTNKIAWSKNGKWPAYRQEEAIAIIQATEGIPVVLGHEGEKCVEAARTQGLASITWVGSSSDGEIMHSLGQIKTLTGKDFLLAYCVDNDSTGWNKARRIEEICSQAGVGFVAIDLLKIQPSLQDKGDVADIFESGMTGDELVELIIQQIEEITTQKQQLAQNTLDVADDGESEPDNTFLQKGFNTLYGETKWMCADGKLYYWHGKGYRYSPDAVERRRITNYCNSYGVMKKKGDSFVITYPYAKPNKVKELLEWVKLRVEIDPQLLNPPGVNCTNGVLAIDWSGPIPRPVLEEHDPGKHFYTYEPLVKYDPKANPKHCDRLLQCLDSPQQQILLRNLGASLDLAEVRKRRGRETKVILACGLGANGKDSIRQVVSIIYGHQGMTSCSLADFVAYDEGRKFALAPLVNSRVNWASENPQTTRLDKIQSLKLFATGNVLHSERKGKDHIEYSPNAIGIYNLNETPPLYGTIQATIDRIVALIFDKTFKNNPDPNNPKELLADPRFAYDVDFVQECVAPAFLNKMIAGLQALIVEGIDYSCTQQALEEIQAENSHLFQFCKDTGLAYNHSGIVTAFDIWQRLENWYIDNGTLSFEESSNGKVKAIWQEQSKPSDKTVKAINQALPRIKALFPKAKLTTVPHPSGKRKLQALQGISFDNVPMSITGTPIAISPPATPNTTPNPHQQSHINQDFHTTHTSYEGSDEKNDEGQQKADLDPEAKSDINVNVDRADQDWDGNLESKSDINPNVDFENEIEGAPLVWEVCDEVPARDTASSTGVESGVSDELIAMEKDLLTTESVQHKSDDVAPACPNEDKAASQQPANVQPQEKPKSDKSRFSPETENLIGNVALIRECIAWQSWEMISTLTEKWTGEFKSAVWNLLTLQEREAVKQLKPLEDT